MCINKEFGMNRSLTGMWGQIMDFKLFGKRAGLLMMLHFWRVRKDGGISGPL